MTILAIYLYLCGAMTTVLALVSTHKEIRTAELIVALLWPVIVPAAVASAIVEGFMGKNVG